MKFRNYEIDMSGSPGSNCSGGVIALIWCHFYFEFLKNVEIKKPSDLYFTINTLRSIEEIVDSSLKKDEDLEFYIFIQTEDMETPSSVVVSEKYNINTNFLEEVKNQSYDYLATITYKMHDKILITYKKGN